MERLLRLLGFVAVAVLLQVELVLAGGNWNDEQIDWQPYEPGLAQAKQADKPVCLVFFTEWCPHCTKYSKVFHDPKVVDQAREFVMIRVDKDKHPQLSKQHAPDGEYIPRTYFLSPAGIFDPTVHVSRDKYKYFYDYQTPDAVLNGIPVALKKNE